ncbi:MAG: response regulator [Pseudomonadota bacterium]
MGETEDGWRRYDQRQIEETLRRHLQIAYEVPRMDMERRSLILLVEDNELNRDMLSRRLERKGFRVATAHDGAQAIATAAKDCPDLILMDMGLPVMDGWEVTQKLKANPATQNIPIIGLSAHALSADQQKALAAGCNDYDTKPVDFERLLAKMAKFVRV